MKLEEGEIVCDKCNGTGKCVEEPTLGDLWGHSWCSKCHGKKKVDWITNVIGETPCHYIKPGVYVQEIDLSEYVISCDFAKGGGKDVSITTKRSMSIFS